VRFGVAFDGFFVTAALALDVLAAWTAFLAETFADAAPRTSLIALVCS
jgi:hypothetical protein